MVIFVKLNGMDEWFRVLQLWHSVSHPVELQQTKLGLQRPEVPEGQQEMYQFSWMCFNEYGDRAPAKIHSFKTFILIDHDVKIYDFVGGKFTSLRVDDEHCTCW